MSTPHDISSGEGKSKKYLISLRVESAAKAEWLAGELNVSKAEAEELKAKLEAAGATVEVK